MNTGCDVVLLAGNGPLSAELGRLAADNGYRTAPMEQLPHCRARVAIAVEVTNADLAAKRSTIERLDRGLPPSVPIAVTSTAVSATEIASWTGNPERVCGFGTFAPLAERAVIELAPALQTADVARTKVGAFFRSLGKDPVEVNDEVGLVFPRIVSLMINEAAFMLAERLATAEHIDTAMKKGMNWPYGPLEWGDRIGLDEVCAVIRGLHRDLGEERYRPAPLLRKLVLAGRFGVRAGRGFYEYEHAYATPPPSGDDGKLPNEEE